MTFPNDFWEPIFFVALIIIGLVAYAIATHNRGSFADAPDWSKVVRRIIELSCVFIAILLAAFFGWSAEHIVRNILLIIISAVGIFIVPILILIFKFDLKEFKKKIKNVVTTEKLSEHLVNAIILALFMLSATLVALIVLARGTNQPVVCAFLFILLDLLLSAEFSFLLFQLYYMVIFKKVPSEEIIQIIRICKELNE
jgi:hypothetical protein